MLRKFIVAGAALALLLSAGSAAAQKLDANGRCHDASGQFAKAEVCGGGATSLKATPKAATKSASAAAAKPMAAAAPATAEKCRDDKGHFVKCGAAPTSAMSATTTPAKPAKCKDDKGKFAKCGSPGAKPA